MSDLIVDKVGPWTVDDLVGLPETFNRCEIVDGALVMSPPPGVRHEVVSALLRQRLMDRLRPARFVLGPVGVDMGPSLRMPDLVVVDAGLRKHAAARLRPSDIDLAIEVVSPGSLTTDRITKPAHYAAFGIGAFWRVEAADEVSITAYVLRTGDQVYTELGTWSEGDTMQVAEPFRVEIEIIDLVP